MGASLVSRFTSLHLSLSRAFGSLWRRLKWGGKEATKNSEKSERNFGQRTFCCDMQLSKLFLLQVVLQCVCNACLQPKVRTFVSDMSDVRGPAPFSTIKQRDKKFQTECFQILSIIEIILYLVCFVSARTHVMR